MAKSAAFQVIDALPSRAGATFGVAITFFATIYPDKVKRWTDWLMSPEQIRIIGVAGFTLFAIYWALWFWLRRKSQMLPDILPRSPAVNHGVIGVQMHDQSQFHNHGSYTVQVLDRAKPRVVSAVLDLHGNPIDELTFYVRAINGDTEREAFGKSICRAIIAVGGQAAFQEGDFHQQDFEGLRLRGSAGRARNAAKALVEALQAQGFTASLHRDDWGDGTRVLIEVGAR